MHIYHIFAVVIKTKEFKSMFTQYKKRCMQIAYGSTYWYSNEKCIGSVLLKRIGNVWLKHFVNVWLKHIGNIWLI